jgi:hypothetical protein
MVAGNETPLKATIRRLCDLDKPFFLEESEHNRTVVQDLPKSASFKIKTTIFSFSHYHEFLQILILLFDENLHA